MLGVQAQRPGGHAAALLAAACALPVHKLLPEVQARVGAWPAPARVQKRVAQAHAAVLDEVRQLRGSFSGGFQASFL